MVQIGFSVPSYKSVNNCCLSKDGTKLVFGCKKSIIPDGVTEIAGYAFTGCSELTSVEIPDSVTEIGERAFFGCTGLTSVEIPLNCNLSQEAFDLMTKVTRRK